jgi:propionyl-CoA carboxylase alpha chain
MHKPKETLQENLLLSPMPGLVVDIKVKPGDRVYQGDDLITIESMKMEAGVPSPCDAEVDEIKTNVGQAVQTGDVLLTFKTQ